MQLGTSRFGLIAVVSLLVTAAPERNESGSDNRESKIDHSSGATENVRISRSHYTWQSRVASAVSSNGLNEPTGSSFVKKDLVKRGSESRPESSSSLTTYLVRHNDRNIETSTTISRFTIDLSPSTRISNRPRNFKSPSNQTNDWSTSSSGSFLKIFHENEKTISSQGFVESSQNSEDKFVVTLDSPISDFFAGTSMSATEPARRQFQRQRHRHRRRRRRRRSRFSDKRETITLDGNTKIHDEFGDKIRTTNDNEATKMRRRRSSNVESAVTQSHSLTTITSTFNISRIITLGQRHLDVNFSNLSQHHEDQTMRDSHESSNNKDNFSESHSDNGQRQTKSIFRPTTRAISLKSKLLPHPTNYPLTLEPNDHFSTQNQISPQEIRYDREVKHFGEHFNGNETMNHSVDENLPKDEAATNELREKSLVHESETIKDNGTTTRSLIQMAALGNETIEQLSITEEISRVRQITEKSLEKVSSLLRLTGNVDNTSSDDVIGSFDNHKGIRARSFQITRQELQKQEVPSLGQGFSLSSRMPEQLGVKETHLIKDFAVDRTDKTTVNVNQMTFPKLAYPITKNKTKQSINLIDGRANKIFYEIKPSLITDMDRGDDVDATTTTTRRSFDKFLLPSVPSAFGKFGPYFLDEEDRRNVTERIGNTVQLDCRIGLLGHRKVTWLQHYKDSFRLLTVERESYSVDRRISLNFQYPDNWRLQIAYASIRDSGLYKCQVEIDQDRSLVKRYNVIITAPILTITDDSGREVSGERHLKAGSALKLRCEARDVIQRLNESVLWMRGDETLTDDVSENRTTEMMNENEVTVVISTLLVERAIPRHAGNYSCVVPDKAKTTIAVHVLNGELPAAVQHGSGVSTAVLNLWLIHLTASYGFFR